MADGDVFDLFGDGTAGPACVTGERGRKPGTQGSRVASIEEYVGRKFGMVLVLGVAQRGRRGVTPKLLGRCDCGTERVFGKQKLTTGSTKSCGCLDRITIPQGTRFGSWTVGEKVETHSGGKERFYFKCYCACGTEAIRDGRTLQKGLSTSCGCERAARLVLPNAESAFKSILQGYRRGARVRGLPFDISVGDFRALIKRDCHYCGCAPENTAWPHKCGGGAYTYNGIDRLDSSEGYALTNVVPACFWCNRMKRAQSVADFSRWAGRVATGPHPTQLHPLSESGARAVQRPYKHNAMKRAYVWDLTPHQVRELARGSCHYCGAGLLNEGRLKNGTRYQYNGIDRIDNTSGYAWANCRSTCLHCNRAKSDLPVDDFLAHVRRISAHQQVSISSK